MSALGDFPTSNGTGASLSLTAQNAALAFPSNTLAVEASARSDSSDRTFIGFSERKPSGLDFLLWPQGSSCELARGGSYPAGLGGEALGYASASGLLLIAGSEGFASPAVVGALTFDTRTGRSLVVDPRSAMRQPRSFATVTEFGEQLLVAGGEYPIHESASPASVFNDSAEVYDPSRESFEAAFVPLVLGVTRHAAVTLESGETVLVGGKTTASAASSFIQVVSPASRTAKLLGTLSVGRSAPTLLRLEDGRLFVAGGEDAQGRPVAALEWLGADGLPLPAPFDGARALPPRFDRAYAALAGGAVLAVGGCEDRAPEADEDCARACARGCPAARSEAFWISPEGEIQELEPPSAAQHVSLLPGSDGRPWLIANGAESRDLELQRFNPWQARFEPVRTEIALGAARAAPRFVSTGLDAFTWLSQDPQGVVLSGARLATRSAFSTDIPLVTPRDPDDAARPAHLVPDHAPSADFAYEGGPGALVFAVGAPAAAKPCVWIGDARFGEFSAEISYSSAAAPGLRVGTANCAPPMAGEGGRILLERRGINASLTVGDARAQCTVSEGRIALGVCASELGQVRVTRISVERGR